MKIKSKGFTLVELMIVVAIIAILAVISVVLYTSQVQRGRRADGMDTLTSISLAEERYRSTHTTYGTLAQVWPSGGTSPAGYYTVSVSNPTATGYSLSAQVQGSQVGDTEDGVSCATLTLAVSNGTVTKTPSTCWPQ